MRVLSDGSEQIQYADPSFPMLIEKINVLTFPDMTSDVHWHEDVELIYVLKGHMFYNVGGKKIWLSEGNGIFLNSRQVHYNYSEDGTECLYYCIIFPPSLLSPSMEIANRYVTPLINDPSLPYLLLRKEYCQNMFQTINYIGDIWLSKAQGRDFAVLGLLYKFWNELLDLIDIDEDLTVDGNLLIQKQMLDFIQQNYASRITLSQIAASGGVCKSKCCQLFKQYMGRTPNDFLNSYRLEKAMQLLRSTDQPITEIAYACGFCGPSYFSEQFMKRKGMSPSEYRKA